MFGDFALLLVAFVQIETVTKGDALAGGHGQIPRGLIRERFEIMPTKGIGRKQAIIAHVPPGGMLRILRMIENGHAHGFVLHRAVVIAPFGAFAPGLLIPHAGAVDDMAMTDFAFEPHRFSQAHCHRPFFGVPEDDIFVRRVERNREIE